MRNLVIWLFIIITIIGIFQGGDKKRLLSDDIELQVNCISTDDSLIKVIL